MTALSLVERAERLKERLTRNRSRPCKTVTVREDDVKALVDAILDTGVTAGEVVSLARRVAGAG